MTHDQIIALLSEVFNNNLFIVAAGFTALKLWGVWTRSETLIIRRETKKTEFEIRLTRKRK